MAYELNDLIFMGSSTAAAIGAILLFLGIYSHRKRSAKH
jgi:hypothetical protein